MTLKRTSILFIFLCVGFFSYSQTTNAFRVNYDQALFDLPGNAVEAITPTNYVFAGTNLNFLPIYGTVTQVDNIGNLVWSKRYYDGSLGFQINDIKKDAASSEYYLCGGSESNAGVFMRINSTGAVVASTKFSIAEADGAYFNRVIKASDGGYVAVGYVTGYDPDGGGAEIDFAPITYTDNNGDSQTDYISSPLIVKMDANGNHLWHKVFRYYTAATKNPTTERIYNDAYYNDVVEVTDGYIAVGQYDVNQHRSATNSDGDDATPTDAIILKTTTGGAITYHKQFDTPSSSTSQAFRYLTAINKTSVGDPIAAGSTDSGREWITKFQAAGGFALTYSNRYTYSTFFGTPDPVEISQIYEANGSTDLITMGMYIKPLSFVFSNSIHRVNSTATSNVWAKYYTFSLATILPRGSQTSDNGFIMSSTVMGASFDYHLIKTDPSGDTPLAGCAPTTFTPTASAGPTTIADPYYNSWSGTVGPSALALLVSDITPTSSVQCSYVACTAPTISAQPTDQTICSSGSGNLTVTASAGPYQWQYNNGGTWANVSNGTPSGFAYTNGTTNNMTITTTSAAQGTYQFRVIVGNTGCETTSNTITVTVPGATQLAPTGNQCSGTALNFSASPTSGATYAWTVTPPGGTSASPTSGSGQTFTTTPTNTTGSNQTFTVGVQITYNGVTCPVNFNATIYSTPSTPVIGTITQPSCSVTTGSVALSGLPASGSWTVTASPGGATTTGSGTTTTFSGLTANTTYTFSVTNSNGCTSSSSSNAVINAAPSVPSAPGIGTITQPTCSVSTGSVALSGLPASGTWTVTASPGGATITGTGTTATFSGLAPGSYTFTVSGASGSSTIFSEDFETGAPGWNLNVSTGPEGSDPNFFQVDDDEGGVAPTGCGVANNGDETLHITSVFNPAGGAAYDAGGLCGFLFCPLTNRRAESPAISSVGQSGLTLNFNYIAKGAIPLDQATVWYNDGTGWYQLGAALNSPLCGSGQGQWTAYSSALPASCNNIANLKIAIRWVNNDDGVGTDPSVAVNNIVITAAGTGCSSPASSSATINAAPTTPTAPVVGTITQATCSVSTGSVALSGLPASGSWTVTASPGGSTTTGSGTSTTFSGLTANTTYTFTVTNASGCTSSASTSAALNAAPTVPTAPVTGTVTQPTCVSPTGSVVLSGLPASGTWTVTASPGGATQTGTGTSTTFTGLTAGTSYTFTVTNSAGCTSVASSSVAINSVPGAPTAPVIGTITQPTCSVSTASVALSGLPASGTWTVTTSPGGATTTGTGTTTTISGLTAATTYTFTVTNDLGCTSSSSANAVINAAPATPTAPVVGTITQPTCSTATGSVDLSGLPASGTWTVTTSPGGLTSTGTGTSTTFSGLSANTNYTFTVTNSDGCISSSSTSAAINAQPATPSSPITGTVTQPTCTDPTGTVDLSGLPSGTWTVTASPGGTTQTGTGSTVTFTGLAPGADYTFTVTNDASCTSSASSSVTIDAVPGAPSAPTAGSVTQPTCAIPTGTIDVDSPLGAEFTYSIDGTNFQSTTTFSGLNPGSYTITVLDNISGCSSVSATAITIDPVAGAPVITLLSSSEPTCNGDADGTLTIDVSGGQAPYTYVWVPNAGSGPSLTGLTAGDYDVTVTDDLGCSTSESFTINEPAVISSNGTVTDVICGTSDGSISTSASGGSGIYTYLWTPGGELTSGISGLSAGDYSVTITDDNGCNVTENFTVSTTGSIPVDIDPNYSEIEPGESVQLTSTGGPTYSWTPSNGLSCSDCSNPIASPDVTTTYYLTVSDDNGCTGADTAIVVVTTPCGDLFVPTVFSPNGTGPDANDKLCVFGTAICIEELLFQVYDRWGEKVYETTDIELCWDGKYKGKDMNSGIYVYRLHVILNDGTVIDETGNTTLVR